MKFAFGQLVLHLNCVNLLASYIHYVVLHLNCHLCQSTHLDCISSTSFHLIAFGFKFISFDPRKPVHIRLNTKMFCNWGYFWSCSIQWISRGISQSIYCSVHAFCKIGIFSAVVDQQDCDENCPNLVSYPLYN